MIPRPIVLTVGDDRRQEFVPVMAWLRQRASVICWPNAQQTATTTLEQSAPPALVIWLQSFSGEFTQADGDAVAAKWPGVNMVCAYAAFAEGETRTGKPLSGVQRFPWYGWAARMEPLWRIACPENDSPEQIIPPASRSAFRVGVYSGAQDMKTVLCEALCALGYDACPLPVVIDQPSRHTLGGAVSGLANIAVAIWEESRDPRALMLNVADFASAVAPCPVVAITGFPRWQDAQQLAACGVNHLLGKPFHLAELAYHVDALAAARDAARS